MPKRLSLLNRPQCPLCGAELPVQRFWWRAPADYRGFLLSRRPGIACNHCDAKFEVVQNRVFAARLVIFIFGIFFSAFCLLKLSAVSHQQLTEAELLFAAFATAALATVAYIIIPPLFTQLRPIGKGARVRFPLSGSTRT
jgi:hypothetical protein